MSPRLSSIIHPAPDMDAAKALFGALLGKGPDIDRPYYAAFDVDGVQVGLDPSGGPERVDGPVAYYDVDDLDATIATLTAAGARVAAEPTDVGGGARIAVLRDAGGNPIGLRSAG